MLSIIISYAIERSAPLSEMEIRQFRYFAEVYRTGSLSLAAENLSMTQPALSQQIALLERELKTRLFDRSRKGMTATEAGEAFAPRAALILAQITDLETTLRPKAEPGEVTFAVGETLAAHFVPALMKKLKVRFPETRFRVRESNLTEMKTALREGQVDFALSPEMIDDRAYTNRYLLEDEILPVVQANDALATRPEWEKMRHRDWILFQPGSAIRKISDAIFSGVDRKFTPRIVMELSSVAGAVHCLEAGLGIGFISALSLKPGLTPIRVPALVRRRRFYVSYRKNHERALPIVEAILANATPDAQIARR